MRKILNLLFLFVLTFCLAPSASGDFTVDTAGFESIGSALETVPESAGSVTVLLHSGVNDEIVSVPTDRGITDIQFLPAEDGGTVSLPGIARICANGIPFVLGEGIILENAGIYGGECVSGTEKSLKTSSLTIFGLAGFVFGGGFSEKAGLSVVSEPSVILTKTGSVLYEVFGGGHAYGEGSRVSSDKKSVLVEGDADYVLGGGYAEEGGISDCGQTYVSVSEDGSVPVALFSGGSAAGTGSVSSVENAKAVIEGKAASAFSGDFAYGGGLTKINQASRLEILVPGSVENAYMGSFASDPGSDAFVNTAELMNCGETGTVIQRSQSADNASAKTLITALFPCESNQ